MAICSMGRIARAVSGFTAATALALLCSLGGGGGQAAYAESANGASESTLQATTLASESEQDAATTSSSAEAYAFQFAENGGGAYTDAYQNVAFTNDGGFVVSGYTMGDSESPKWTYTVTKGHTNNNAVLVKYDKNRNIEWSHAYGTSTGVTVFNAMDVLKDGRIAAIGRQSAPDGIAVDGAIVTKAVSWYLVLVDPNDPTKYTEYFIGGTAGDQGYGITTTPDGGFAITGWSAKGSESGYLTYRTVEGDTVGEFSTPKQLWQSTTETIAGIPVRTSNNTDTIVVKFDKESSVEWCAVDNVAVSTGANFGTASENVESIACDNDGNIVVVGNGQLGKYVKNATIAKFSGADGSLLWHKSAGRTGLEDVPTDEADKMTESYYRDIAVLADGSYVAVGAATHDANSEEGWQTTSQKDTIVAHYKSDGSLISVESFGRAGDSNSRPEGVTALSDGGYLVFGSQSGYLYEDDLISKGYSWGNYGAQDAILVKYSADDNIVWSENYGSTNGDWFNGAAESDGQVIVVGESNGKYGSPNWGNNGGIDGIVLVSDGTAGGASDESGIVSDGNVIWKDGTYSGVGTGYAGDMTMQIIIENNKITDVGSTRNSETGAYFWDVEDYLFPSIVEKQTANVDVISGATLSSNGAIEGTTKALSKASAAYVDDLIAAIAAAEGDDAKKSAVQTAANAYAQLGTYALDSLSSAGALANAATQYGITLSTKTGTEQIVETNPELAPEGLAYNDRYYKIQDGYYSGINATALAEAGYTGEGVKIAVVDSGITGSHNDLDYTHILEGWDYGEGASYEASSAPGNALNSDASDAVALYDNNGHGTAVTGILAAIADNEIGIAGLLSEADIVPLRVIPTSKSNETYRANSSKQVAQAIIDAVDRYDVDVITTSLEVDASDELEAAIAHATEKGVIILAAAGNSSTADSTGEDAYVYPAAYNDVIGVGAVDKNLNVRTNSQKNDSVFVTAPGENIALLDVSRNARCTISSGTSYSSPIVAAMAAAAKQSNADTTVDQFKELLTQTSQDRGSEGYDTSYGYGVVDMQAFVDSLLAAEVSQFCANVTAEDEDAVAAARAAYEALSDAAKAKVDASAVAKLKAAEKAVADAKAAAKAAADKAAAEKAAAAKAAALAAASTVNKATLTAADVKKASDLGATTITLGPKVKKIAKGAFAGTKITTIVAKTKKLKKKSVKGSLKGSKVKLVKVQIGKKKVNKKFVKKYKKIFTKKVAGKKAKVKA